jgi:thiol-disulfide isomerase/thioredoxin
MTARRLGSVIYLSLILAVAALGVAGDDKAPKEEPKSDAAKPRMSVKIVSWEETLKLVADQKGKIVVLDAWSTSCEPCKKEFPNLVKLHNKHGGKEVVCMSLSCDYAGIKNKPPEFYRERVEKFLVKQGAEFQNLMSSDASEDLFEKMKLSSIPAVYVFGRDGKLVKRFDNEKIKTDADEFTYADVTRLVEELIAKK